MSRRLFTLVTALYPRAWRERYAEEMSDLCEEFVNAGETTRLRLASAILVTAVAERLNALRSSRRRALLSGATLIIALGAVTFATDGYGLLGSALPAKPYGSASSAELQLGRGHAQATSSLREPSGVILLARISAPRSDRAYVDASLPGTAQVIISTEPSRNDPSLSCQVQGQMRVCTEAFEWCPMPQATWQLRVVKQSGPSGLVRVDLAIGPRPSAVASAS
jgi:hypothetical protein